MTFAPQKTGVLGDRNFRRDIYHKFSRLSLPRHTSYPSVPHWKSSITEECVSDRLKAIVRTGSQVGFYVHVPFCEKACAYCGCNKLIIRHDHQDVHSMTERYLAGIEKEVDRLRNSQVDAGFHLEQMHWGGGTPTWLNPDQIERLWSSLSKVFNLTDKAEVSVEVDPRFTSFDHLRVLRGLGFNRISLGVQDFDAGVQDAIQRIQPVDIVRNTVEQCRSLGFESINFDLIYGLPRQTMESMQRTLRQVVELGPDRIAFYRLALLPNIFKLQRSFREQDMPDDESILDFFAQAIDTFGTNGWTFVGLDHFAKESDDLKVAMQYRNLRRSFQGISTGVDMPIVGFGPSAISDLGDLFFQNDPQFQQWATKLAKGDSVTVKAHLMSQDDQLRRWLINQIYCYREIDKSEFNKCFGVDFDRHFSHLDATWSEMKSFGLIDFDHSVMKVKPLLGWFLLRVVASVFDSYLPKHSWKTGLDSKVASRVG